VIGIAPFPVGAVTKQFCGHAESSSLAIPTFTFPGLSLGSEAEDRLIVVGISAGPNAVSSVTIAGVAATIYVQHANFPVISAIATAMVPVGLTGTIAVSFTGNNSFAAVSVYALTGALPSPFASATSGAAAPTASLSVPSGGVAIGIVRGNFPGDGITLPTWTGVTQDHASTISNTQLSSSASGFPLASPVTMTATFPSVTNASGSFAIFGP
jgi:hypothetical protein